MLQWFTDFISIKNSLKILSSKRMGGPKRKQKKKGVITIKDNLICMSIFLTKDTVIFRFLKIELKDWLFLKMEYFKT